MFFTVFVKNTVCFTVFKKISIHFIFNSSIRTTCHTHDHHLHQAAYLLELTKLHFLVCFSPWQEATWRKESLYFSLQSCHSPSLREVRTGSSRKLHWEPKETLLLACSSWLLSFLSNLGQLPRGDTSCIGLGPPIAVMKQEKIPL